MLNYEFEFEKQEREESLARKRSKQKQMALFPLLLVGIAAFYYLNIYLPEEEIKKYKKIKEKITNAQSLEEIDKLNGEINNLNDEILPNDMKRHALKQIQAYQKKKWEKTPEQLEEEAYQKGRIWELPVKSWADLKVRGFASTLVTEYQEEANIFPGGSNNPNFHFSRTASYDIYFPSTLREKYETGKSAGETNCHMLERKEDLVLSEKILAWYQSVVNNPVRGDTERGENNTLFYGMSRTGKSATVRNLCFESNKCPLIIIKGSSLTPRIKSKLKVDEKFAYTISEIEWVLEKTYCFDREINGEIHYTLFVDECNQISNNSMTFDPHLLQFVKECLEGNQSSRKQETNNLWVMATNHLEQLEEAVYQSGRLANPLNFSWTWTEFLKHAKKSMIYDQLPERWKQGEDTNLTAKEDKWVKKFNVPIFYKDFVGNDPKQPNKPRFWNLFITNNPDAILKEEIQIEAEESGEETTETQEKEIEIGEFLQYFWDQWDSGNLENYQGGFKSLKKVEVEDVLDSNLPEMADILATSSNEMNESLEALRQEIETLNKQLNFSSSSNSSDLQNSINDLYKLVGELRGRIDDR